VPSSTDAKIEELTLAIRKLCRVPFSPEAEANLRKLARELRAAIQQHVRMAHDSLSVKKAAIDKRDPKEE
jgi:mRNA-degrading endonuclease RelE of RelBE toxin-antitoxin system